MRKNLGLSEGPCDPEPTLESLKKQVKLSPDDINLRLDLARAYEYDAMVEEAISEYEAVLALDADNSEAQDHLGILYEVLADPDSVLDGGEGLSPDPENTDHGLAMAEEAIAEHKAILAQDPDDYDTHYHLGHIYNDLGRVDEAISEIRIAASLLPGQFDPWYNLGALHYGKEMIPEAVAYYKKAVETEPDHTYAHYRLAMGYVRLGRYAEAIDEFQRALYFDSMLADAKFRIEYIPRLSKAPDDEIKAARKAVAKDVDNAAAHHWLGVVLMLMGITDGCVDELRKAVSLDPDNAWYHYDLAYALDYEDDEKAIDEMEAVLRLEPENAEALLFLGITYGGYSRFDDGIRMFEKAAKILPDNNLPHYFMGILYSDMGVAYGDRSTFEKACKELKEALRLNPESFQAHGQLAGLYIEEELYDEAIREYEKALELEPCIKLARENIEKLREMNGE